MSHPDDPGLSRAPGAEPQRELGQTPSQTIGPFFHPGLLGVRGAGRSDPADPGPHVLATSACEGQRMRLSGVVYDGLGEPVSDALLEIWQADAHGRYPHPADAAPGHRDASFRGFGRAATDAAGRFSFETIKPGAVSAPGAPSSPHIDLIVMARGLLLHLFTRVYFEDDPSLERDPVLALVAPSRRHTLIARRRGAGDAPLEYELEVWLQGPRETVFFEV